MLQVREVLLRPDAVAREFGGERSPAFVNAVLDRWWKRRGGAG